MTIKRRNVQRYWRFKPVFPYLTVSSSLMSVLQQRTCSQGANLPGSAHQSWPEGNTWFCIHSVFLNHLSWENLPQRALKGAHHWWGGVLQFQVAIVMFSMNTPHTTNKYKLSVEFCLWHCPTCGPKPVSIARRNLWSIMYAELVKELQLQSPSTDWRPRVASSRSEVRSLAINGTKHAKTRLCTPQQEPTP